MPQKSLNFSFDLLDFPQFKTAATEAAAGQESLEGYDQRYRGDSGPVKVAQTFPPMEEVVDFMRRGWSLGP